MQEMLPYYQFRFYCTQFRRRTISSLLQCCVVVGKNMTIGALCIVKINFICEITQCVILKVLFRIQCK